MSQDCGWPADDPEMMRYHDTVWGVPLADSRGLFEFLTLEAAQAGLSWRTILNRREGYQRAFAGFDVREISDYNDAKIESLMQDAGIIRNRLKITATVINARLVHAMQESGQSFEDYIWGLVGGATKVNKFVDQSEIPATTTVSDQMSKRLKADGFKFVGSTTCYALMQATGMVNDHLVACSRYEPLMKMARR